MERRGGLTGHRGGVLHRCPQPLTRRQGQTFPLCSVFYVFPCQEDVIRDIGVILSAYAILGQAVGTDDVIHTSYEATDNLRPISGTDIAYGVPELSGREARAREVHGVQPLRRKAVRGC